MYQAIILFHLNARLGYPSIPKDLECTSFLFIENAPSFHQLTHLNFYNFSLCEATPLPFVLSTFEILLPFFFVPLIFTLASLSFTVHFFRYCLDLFDRSYSATVLVFLEVVFFITVSF